MNLSIFAERLSELMFERKISAPALARILGCGRASVYRYLSGTKMPAVNLFVKMADYFSCTTDFLVGLEGETYAHHFRETVPFSQRLPLLLQHFGISRYRLEKLSGFSQSTLFYWATGKTSPSLEKLVTLAKALQCTLDFILGREV